MRQFRGVIAALADLFTLWQIVVILLGGPALAITVLRSHTRWTWPWLVTFSVGLALLALVAVGVIADRRLLALRERVAKECDGLAEEISRFLAERPTLAPLAQDMHDEMRRQALTEYEAQLVARFVAQLRLPLTRIEADAQAYTPETEDGPRSTVWRLSSGASAAVFLPEVVEHLRDTARQLRSTDPR